MRPVARLTRFTGLVLLVGLVRVAGSVGVDAQQAGGVAQRTEKHGLVLSLSVARYQYALNSLVRARLTVENDSPKTVRLVNDCPYGRLWIEAVTRWGKTLFPPALADTSGAGPCSPSSIQQVHTLKSGAHWSIKRLIILRSGRIRGVAAMHMGSQSF